MAHSDTVGEVQVKVRRLGRRHGQQAEQVWQLQVMPKLESALRALVAELELRVPPEPLHGCMVILNGRNVQALVSDLELHDGDVFMIVPPIAGGC